MADGQVIRHRNQRDDCSHCDNEVQSRAPAQRHEKAAEQNDAKRRCAETSPIKNRCGIAKIMNDEHASEQRQPHQQIKNQCSRKLRHYDLQVAHWRRHQRFKCAGIFFECERTHGDDGRGNQQDEPKIHCAVEHLHQRLFGGFGVECFQQADPTQTQQKHHNRNNDITRPRNELAAKFTTHEGPVRLHQTSSSRSARVTRTKISSSEWRLWVNSRNFQPRSQTMEKICGRKSVPGRGVSAQRKYSPSAATTSKCSISATLSQHARRSSAGAAISATTCPLSLISFCKFFGVSSARTRP